MPAGNRETEDIVLAFLDDGGEVVNFAEVREFLTCIITL